MLFACWIIVSHRLQRKLHHPNVVKILAICDDELAILMEYVDGGDLRVYLSREHPPFKKRVAFDSTSPEDVPHPQYNCSTAT